MFVLNNDYLYQKLDADIEENYLSMEYILVNNDNDTDKIEYVLIHCCRNYPTNKNCLEKHVKRKIDLCLWKMNLIIRMPKLLWKYDGEWKL